MNTANATPDSPLAPTSSWPAPLRHAAFTFSIALLLLAAAYVVYATGGTSYAYPYVALIPVILAAAIYRVLGGLVAAATAGVLIGPWMPLEVELGLMQETTNWVVRLLLFMALGGFTGSLFARLSATSRARERIMRVDSCGLPNQTALLADLSTAMTAAARDESKVGLVLVQIADLSEILRGIGGDSGDALVSAIGQNLSRQIHPAQVYRLGVSELVVLLRYQRFEQLCETVDKISAVGEESVMIHGLPVRAQLVSGVSHTGHRCIQAKELIRQMRVAAFEAMEQQQPVCYYTAEYESNTADSILMIAQVRHALAGGEFELHFQPKIRLLDGAVCGCEGLIRWRKDPDSVIAPGLFMPKVERTTLISPVTRFVAMEAASFLRASDAGPISINFAVSNLFDENLLKWLLQFVQDGAIPPHTLEIEITEGALIRDPEAAKVIIQRLRTAGIAVMLDDFGTGYSSFEHLRHLPISGLKIDRAFVRDLETDRRAWKMMACMIDVAHALDLTVTAEGVETAGQAQLLRELKCDLAQGYYYARPMPAHEYNEWLTHYERELKLQA